jgi:hypothetical protein
MQQTFFIVQTLTGSFVSLDRDRMKQSHSEAAHTPLGGEDYLDLVWNPNVHYLIHKHPHSALSTTW